MQNIKMIIFDVDGTLYDLVNDEVPKSTKDALKELKAKGIKFSVATGRAHYALGKTINDLNPDYIISCNGGTISDNQKIIKANHFTLEDTISLINFTNKYDGGLLFKFDDKMHIYKNFNKISWIKNQMNSDVGKEPFIFNDNMNRHLKSLPLAACLHADEVKVKDELETNTNLSFIKYTKDEFDVINKGINKSIGLKMLLEYLDLNHDEVICFGDNYNDLEMLKAVKYSIAMGNAIQEIKDISYYTTDASNHDGIYKALKHFEII